MSGGVDSSVAAAILKNQGYDCVGIFMHFWSEPGKTDRLNQCCSAESFAAARQVAHQLHFPIYTLNFETEFKKKIVDNFLAQYQNGTTPNPCVRCNKFIKFDLLWRKAKTFGCDYLATGHYIKKSEIRNPRFAGEAGRAKSGTSYTLSQAKDKAKDQSYFLYNLKSAQLPRLLFPLGNYLKTEVRQLAKEINLPVYDKPDSQEICFVKNEKLNDFLKRHLKLKPGPIITVEGKTVGRHQGLPLYTLGQRKGIEIGGTGPFYVVKTDYKSNTLIISNKKDDANLFVRKFTIKEVNWIYGRPKNWPKRYSVKIRYQTPSIKCQMNNNTVTLSKSLRAVTPGQSAVFYQAKKLLGGGVIDKIRQ